MVRVVVDHDLIASPIPVSNYVVIVRGHVPVEIAKPEALPVSSRKHEYVLRSKATREAPVRPWLREVVMRIAGSTVMSNPLIVSGIDVWNVRMTLPVHGNVVPGRGSGLLTSCGGRISLRLGSPRRSRTASRNVSAPHRRATAAAWRPTAPSILRKSSHANQNGCPYNFFHG
jgi:hypothetical protein